MIHERQAAPAKAVAPLSPTQAAPGKGGPHKPHTGHSPTAIVTRPAHTMGQARRAARLRAMRTAAVTLPPKLPWANTRMGSANAPPHG
eukprot:9124066-Alexandrium_andersonii.AAC.1